MSVSGARQLALKLLTAFLVGLIGGVTLCHGGEDTAADTDAEVQPKAPLVFGIVPQQSATRLAAIWGPLIARLSAELDHPVQFATTKDIPTFESCLAAGRFDIAYMNPYHYAVFSEDAEYRVVANQSGKRLRGLLVVREDAPQDSIDALDGEEVAFPSPGAFGASVLPRAEMTKRGIDYDARYVRSHDSVYRAVAAGLVTAGGGVRRTYDAMPEETRAQLRVIYTTDAHTPHAIAIRGDDERLAAVRAALLTLAADAPDLVTALGMKGMRAAKDDEYDTVRALPITPAQTGLDRIDEVQCPFD